MAKQVLRSETLKLYKIYTGPLALWSEILKLFKIYCTHGSTRITVGNLRPDVTAGER
jgi:hypothetical protein